MMHIRRFDILHDVSDAINLGIARGQVEGGFVQGAGWLTMEELVWDSEGRLRTHSPDTYKIPAIGDTPDVFNVAFLTDATQLNVVHGSKAVGEPALMLAISVREAIRDAVGAFGEGDGDGPVRLARNLRSHLRRDQRPDEHSGTGGSDARACHGGAGPAMRNVPHKPSVARGEEPAALVFKNAQLVNVLSAEIYLTNVAVDDGRGVGIGDYEGRETIDLEGRTSRRV